VVNEKTDIGVVLGNNAAFCRRDADGMLTHFAPAAHVVDRRPGGFGEYQGHDAIHAYYGGIFDNVDEINEELEVVSAAEGVVVASCRTWASLSSDMGSGDFSVHYALLIDVRDGLITRLEVHPDADAAIASRR
jgi:ketosteroid isomerase-like protein